MSVLIRGDDVRATTQGILVSKGTATLPQTTDAALFTISGGRVLVLALVGEVTTVIQTLANNTKIKFNPTATGADQDLCAVLNITADVVGELYTISGTVAEAMRSILLVGNPILQDAIILSEGDIELDCAASSTGSIQWDILYVPFDNGATVVAA